MNVANDIRRFEKVFEREGCRFERATMFERFLEFIIAGFDISGRKLDRPFSKEESKICFSLMSEWLFIMQERTRTKEWYDILGEIYMSGIASGSKKSATGQFFTPMHICDFMSKITDPGEHGGESIMDPCCGSGRMLLAGHANHPGNYFCGQDLDRLCCLMAVCNFLVHGINGEVVWGNSLDPNDYREGWRINETLNYTGIPTVTKMDRHESRIYRSGVMAVADKMKEKSEKPEVHASAPIPCSDPEKQVQKKAKANDYVQLSLFEEFQ